MLYLKYQTGVIFFSQFLRKYCLNTMMWILYSFYERIMCEVCGKMMMGFENTVYDQKKHDGKSMDWKKAR